MQVKRLIKIHKYHLKYQKYHLKCQQETCSKNTQEGAT